MATKEDLIRGLNEDLAGEYQAIISYRLFASMATGIHRHEAREFFEKEIPDELGHARFLADKVVALGGEPATEPRPVKVTRDLREMFELALEAETETVQRYEERVRQAEELGMTGLKVELEDLIVDETNHKEEIEKILRNWRD